MRVEIDGLPLQAPSSFRDFTQIDKQSFRGPILLAKDGREDEEI